VSLKSANEAVIGQRYAKAFFSTGVLEHEVNEFLEIGKLFVGDALFVPMLNASKGKLSKDKKNLAEWIRSFSATLKLSQKVTYFLMVIALKKRLGYLVAILKAVEDIANKKVGRDFVTLRVFSPLSNDTLAELTQEIKRVTKIEPILDIVIDPSILGGYVIHTRSIVIDNSLKKRIEKLHNIMKGVA
jgi:F-type H+-transporting ATPase subunit delta